MSVALPRFRSLAVAGLCLLNAGLVSASALAEQAAPTLRPALIAPLAVKSLMLGAAMAGDRLVAVGERGHILLSDDNGQTWRQVAVPANAMLTGVSFVDAQRGWAVGHDAVILHTTDGGASWTVQHADPDLEQPLMDVLFDADGLHGIAVGAYGLFLETTDGGATWEGRQISEDDFHFNAILAPTADTRLIVGEAGTVLHSADTGATWQPLTTPYDGSFFDALVLGPQSFLLYGLQGNILRTEDGGQTWASIPSGTTAGLMGGAVLADGRVEIVGAQGTVLTSTDGGRSFTLNRRADRVALADAIQAKDGRLILLGEEGPIPVQP